MRNKYLTIVRFCVIIILQTDKSPQNYLGFHYVDYTIFFQVCQAKNDERTRNMKDFYPRSHPVFCRICGSPISRQDLALTYSGKVVCDTCISEISVREILRICEFSSKEDMLYALGFKTI